MLDLLEEAGAFELLEEEFGVVDWEVREIMREELQVLVERGFRPYLMVDEEEDGELGVFGRLEGNFAGVDFFDEGQGLAQLEGDHLVAGDEEELIIFVDILGGDDSAAGVALGDRYFVDDAAWLF